MNGRQHASVRRAMAVAIVGLAAGAGCDGSDPPVGVDAASDAAVTDDADETGDARPADDAIAQPESQPPESFIQTRRADKGLLVFAAPSYDAPFRGKIPARERFGVVRTVEADDADDGCSGDGWAKIGPTAFACLESTSVTKKATHDLPVVPTDQIAPFVYFRRNKRAPEDAPAPSIWRSRKALREGADPIATLEREHDYAWARRRRGRGGPFLVADNHRVVREKDVERLEPSDFAGHDLRQAPIADGVHLAWSVHWPSSPVFADPGDEHPAASVEFHTAVFVEPTPARHRRRTFWKVAGEHGAAGQWLDAKFARRFEPFEPPEAAGDDGVWIDVDLAQQTLAIYRGETPEFVTLVSSGNWKNPTPTGLFRVVSKQAHDDMRSRADEDEPYHVEGVPWVMYFDGRYALHGTFWHNRFGLRTSHGCVNLSALDAARVYEAVLPDVLPGWLTVYEHAQDPGTLVRIRHGAEHPPDRREAPLQRTRDQYG